MQIINNLSGTQKVFLRYNDIKIMALRYINVKKYKNLKFRNGRKGEIICRNVAKKNKKVRFNNF